MNQDQLIRALGSRKTSIIIVIPVLRPVDIQPKRMTSQHAT